MSGKTRQAFMRYVPRGEHDCDGCGRHAFTAYEIQLCEHRQREGGGPHHMVIEAVVVDCVRSVSGGAARVCKKCIPGAAAALWSLGRKKEQIRLSKLN